MFVAATSVPTRFAARDEHRALERVRDRDGDVTVSAGTCPDNNHRRPMPKPGRDRNGGHRADLHVDVEWHAYLESGHGVGEACSRARQTIPRPPLRGRDAYEVEPAAPE